MSGSSSLPPSRPPLNAPTGPRTLRFATNTSFGPRVRLRPTFSPWIRAPSPSPQAYSSSPFTGSPLQQSFPADPEMTHSAPASPGKSMDNDETLSRSARIGETGSRLQGDMRSSSVPIIIRAPDDSGDENEESAQRSLNSRSELEARAPSPHPSLEEPQAGQNHRSVKHLTCFWWRDKGSCKFSDEECLYAHYDTGHYTNAPRQVVPGEPAKAGKSLERELNRLALSQNRSSASLASLGVFETHATGRDSLNVTNSGPYRPETPWTARSRPVTPSPRGSVDLGYSTQLRNDNDFLRGLVTQAGREKEALLDTIQSLKTDKSQLMAQVDSMKDERTVLLEEREALQATIARMQFPTGINTYTQQGLGAPARTASAGTFAVPNPWGAIGSGPRGNASRPDTPDETPADSPSSQGRRTYSYLGPMTYGPGTFPAVDGPDLNNSTSLHMDNNISASNPATTAYGAGLHNHQRERGRTLTRDNNNSEANGVGGEALHNVLRYLGPSF